ncbi:hypothetical protein, partial [Thiospirillum jenense]|uniref:hypothetical protein n=1 Tax=Thiospirillum jenense TaxID=1653858 RepID=UPI001EEC5397
ILQLIREGLVGIPTGTKLTLEQIFERVDKKLWECLTYSARRKWGKAFKQCVHSGRITELQLREKKHMGFGPQLYEYNA